MWVKKTPGEIYASRKIAKRKKLLLASVFGLFVAIFGCLVLPRSLIGVGGKYFYSADEAISRLPGNLLGGTLITACFYFFEKISDPVYLCPKCDKTYKEGEVVKCPCGESLENLEQYKWV